MEFFWSLLILCVGLLVLCWMGVRRTRREMAGYLEDARHQADLRSHQLAEEVRAQMRALMKYRERPNPAVWPFPRSDRRADRPEYDGARTRYSRGITEPPSISVGGYWSWSPEPAPEPFRSGGGGDFGGDGASGSWSPEPSPSPSDSGSSSSSDSGGSDS